MLPDSGDIFEVVNQNTLPISLGRALPVTLSVTSVVLLYL